MPFRKILNWWKKFFLSLASGIYSSLGGLRVKFYQWGIFRTRRLSVPVICVGDLILGGSGKTPTVIALAEHFQNEGYQVAVLCSGYKKNKPRKITVVSEGRGPTVGPHEGGDEAVMIARRLPGIRVLSGRDRYAAGKIAVENFNTNLLIMDGGFQHLGLHRDLNILLITPDLFLPKESSHQILREPLSGMQRADLGILFHQAGEIFRKESFYKRIQKISPSLSIFSAVLEAQDLSDIGGKQYDSSILKGKKILAFAGIARPKRFFNLLEQNGALCLEKIIFPDHVKYSPNKIRKLTSRAGARSVDALITTEKDFVKIKPNEAFNKFPLYFQKVSLRLPWEDPDFSGRIFGPLQKSKSQNQTDLVEVFVPNLNRRFSGVTASIQSVVPALSKYCRIHALGNSLPPEVPNISWSKFLLNHRTGPKKIFHCRRNVEMAVGWILKNFLGYPLILIFTSAAQRRHKRFTRFLYGKMNQIICPTEAATGYINRPVVIIPHGVDTELFRPPLDRRTLWKRKFGAGEFGLGIFGRVRPFKGTGDFVDALCEILPLFPDWAAVIVGEITPKYRSFQKTLQNKINLAGLEGRINFLGKMTDYREVVKWYQAVSLVVIPPWTEGFGLTVPEAMSSGCGVVATRTGAFEQIIEDSQNGWLVPIKDPSALKKILKKIMDSPPVIGEVGARARRRIEDHYSIDQEARQLSKVYKELFLDFSPKVSKTNE